jgi:hypothetical protein
LPPLQGNRAVHLQVDAELSPPVQCNRASLLGFEADLSQPELSQSQAPVGDDPGNDPFDGPGNDPFDGPGNDPFEDPGHDPFEDADEDPHHVDAGPVCPPASVKESKNPLKQMVGIAGNWAAGNPYEEQKRLQRRHQMAWSGVCDLGYEGGSLKVPRARVAATRRDSPMYGHPEEDAERFGKPPRRSPRNLPWLGFFPSARFFFHVLFFCVMYFCNIQIFC